MGVTDQSLADASAMGARAGESWRTTGIPAVNPFDAGKFPELAQAWRGAYFDAARV